MSNKIIVFSGTFLSMNDKKLNIEDFKSILPENKYTITENNKIHIYNFSYFENYLKVTFGDGSSMPRNPNVITIDTNETLPNPRLPNQVEPKETYGLIDFSTCLLWLSNSRKKNNLIDFLKKTFKTVSFVSKDVYDEQKFIETLKRIDDIRISAVPNIFSQTSVLTETLSEEINGYEATTAILHFHYQNRFVNENIIKKITSIFKNKTNFNGVLISGRDERNLGMLFNSDEFSRKIEFKAIVDDNEMFNSEDLFSKLILNIKNENN